MSVRTLQQFGAVGGFKELDPTLPLLVESAGIRRQLANRNYPRENVKHVNESNEVVLNKNHNLRKRTRGL